MLTYTYRLYEADKNERKSTAVKCKDETILQVYPTKHTYDTLEEWRGAWPMCPRMEEETHETIPRDKKASSAVCRRNKEVMEFFEADYQELFTNLEIKSFPRRTPNGEPYVHIDTHDGAKWSIYRSLNFIEPPIVWKNGVRLGSEYEEKSYSPALTAVRWWLMLRFIAPE
jgi:hypothetical protein